MPKKPNRRRPKPKASPRANQAPDPASPAPQNRRRRQGGKGKPFEKGNQLGRRFEPGVSGNPGGRPKSLADHKEACRDVSELVRTRMVHIVSWGDDKDAISAGRELWANGWGKPAQRVEVSGPNGNPMKVTYDDVRQRLNDMATKVAAAVAGTGTDAAGDTADKG